MGYPGQINRSPQQVGRQHFFDCARVAPPRRLVLVDDDPCVHQTVREMLTRDSGTWVMDGFLSGEDALEPVSQAPPQAVLMDIRLPGLSGIECTRKLKLRLPEVPVVMLTGREDVATLLQAVSAGACGYLLKPVASVDLVCHLDKALAGGMPLCLRAERLLLEGLRGLARCADAGNGLSPREHEVMLCLCRQRSNKDAAAALGISEATVHAHLARIFKKLEVHDRQSAIRTFSETWLGGGGVEMPGRDFVGLRPFLDLLRCCTMACGTIQSQHKHGERTEHAWHWRASRKRAMGL